jgi:ribosome-binding factor A
MRAYRKTQSQRQLRVAEMIKRVLAQELAGNELVTRDEETKALIYFTVPITVTEVRVSSDLLHAVVYVMPLGGEQKEEALQFLKRLAKDLRHHLSQQLKTKYIPVLKFVLDESFEQADRIEDLLRKP